MEEFKNEERIVRRIVKIHDLIEHFARGAERAGEIEDLEMLEFLKWKAFYLSQIMLFYPESEVRILIDCGVITYYLVKDDNTHAELFKIHSNK